MSGADPTTRVPIRTSTLRLLEGSKTNSKNGDRFLLELVEREMDQEDVGQARLVLSSYRRRGGLPRPPRA